MAAARKRSVRSSSRSVVRTNSSWASVRGMERERDLGGTVSSGRRRRSGAGTRHLRSSPGSAATRVGERQPAPRRGVPAEAKLREPGGGGGRARRLDLGRSQQVGERVEVVADPDPALGAGLQRRRAATRERIEDDVARPRVAGDEGVGEGRREARQVGAHRVEAVAPQALLVLPLGREPMAGRSIGSSRASWPAVAARSRAVPVQPTWAVWSSIARGSDPGRPDGSRSIARAIRAPKGPPDPRPRRRSGRSACHLHVRSVDRGRRLVAGSRNTRNRVTSRAPGRWSPDRLRGVRSIRGPVPTVRPSPAKRPPPSLTTRRPPACSGVAAGFRIKRVGR